MAIRKYILTMMMGILLISFFTCREDGVAPKTPNISLSAEDVSATDVFLRIKLSSNIEQRGLLLKRDGQTVLAVNNSPLDTLLLNENLLPKHVYMYKAYVRSNGVLTDSSAPLRFTTMDTTTHSFIFEIDTLGDGSSSALYDVAILSDTLAYTVGEIYKKDSTGQFETNCYNLAKWNGHQWELKRIPFIYKGSVWYLPLRCIYAFSENDIWFEAGIHWDGKEYRTIPFNINFPARVNKSWGASSNDFYVVGDGGNIARYSNGTWRKIESGTDIDLTDIWGTPDGKVIWICGFSYSSDRSVLLELRNGQCQILWQSDIPSWPFIYQYDLSSLWTSGTGEFTLTGGEVYRHSYLNKNIIRAEFIDSGYIIRRFELGNFAYRIRGNAKNDLTVVGDAAMIWHFNGKSWHRYQELHNENDRLYSVAISPDRILAVGTRYGQHFSEYALVIRGRR